MTPEHKLLVHLTLLRILDECGPYLLPEVQLFGQLNIEMQPPVTVAEFDTELKFLDNRKLITGVRSDLGGIVKWKITEQGRLARSEA